MQDACLASAERTELVKLGETNGAANAAEGSVIAVLTPAAEEPVVSDHDRPVPSTMLPRMIIGDQLTWAGHVAATLGLSDLMADGLPTGDELVAAVLLAGC